MAKWRPPPWNRWAAIGVLLMGAVAVTASIPAVPRWVPGLLAGVGACLFGLMAT